MCRRASNYPVSLDCCWPVSVGYITQILLRDASLRTNNVTSVIACAHASALGPPFPVSHREMVLSGNSSSLANCVCVRRASLRTRRISSLDGFSMPKFLALTLRLSMPVANYPSAGCRAGSFYTSDGARTSNRADYLSPAMWCR